MNWAQLGDDADAMRLARALVASGEDRLVWVCEASPAAAGELRRLAPAARVTDDWESLLAGRLADTVLVARGPDAERRTDQIRKLLQAGVSVVATHPVVDSMLTYYELEMVREEFHGRLVPLLAARWHPAVEHALELLSAGGEFSIGPVEQLLIERQMTDRTQVEVQRQFARDVDLAQGFVGELSQVSALAPASAERAYANLGVQLAGPSGVPVRWTVGPVVESPGGRLTLLGPQGKLTIDMPDEGPWRVGDSRRTTEHQRMFPAEAWGQAALEHSRRSAAGEDAAPRWVDAARTVELAEAIERSLAKGRTITLYDEDYSEQHTFKGKMAAAGCSLLMLSLALFIASAVAVQMGLSVARYVPWLIAAVLLTFLLMQTLSLVFPPQETAATPSESDQGASRAGSTTR